MSGDARGLEVIARTGSGHHRVRIALEADSVRIECECPRYAKGLTCKHVWAAFVVADEDGYLGDLAGQAVKTAANAARDELTEQTASRSEVKEQPRPPAQASPLSERASQWCDLKTRLQGTSLVTAGGVALQECTAFAARAMVQDGTLHMVNISIYTDGSLRPTCTCNRVGPGRICAHVWATLIAADEKAGFASSRQPWRDVLRLAAPPVEPPRRERRAEQIMYITDVDEANRSQHLPLHLASRSQLKSGAWTPPFAKSISRSAVAQLKDAQDRAIFQQLYGAAESPHSYSYGGCSTTGCFYLNEGLLASLLPQLCATGRFFLRWNTEFVPLSWDGGEPWNLRLRLEAADGHVLRARLERRDERIELAEADVLMPTGYLIARGKVGRYRYPGRFDWISAIRRTGPLRIPQKEVDALVDEVYDLPGTFEVELQESLRPSEVRPKPRPHIQIKPEKDGSKRLNACLSFDYEGMPVAVSDPRDRIMMHKPRRVIIRDRAVEREATELLASLGFRVLSRIDEEDIDYELSVRRFPTAVSALLNRGWNVEAQGRRTRSGGCRLRHANSIACIAFR